MVDLERLGRDHALLGVRVLVVLHVLPAVGRHLGQRVEAAGRQRRHIGVRSLHERRPRAVGRRRQRQHRRRETAHGREKDLVRL